MPSNFPHYEYYEQPNMGGSHEKTNQKTQRKTSSPGDILIAAVCVIHSRTGPSVTSVSHVGGGGRISMPWRHVWTTRCRFSLSKVKEVQTWWWPLMDTLLLASFQVAGLHNHYKCSGYTTYGTTNCVEIGLINYICQPFRWRKQSWQALCSQNAGVLYEFVQKRANINFIV